MKLVTLSENYRDTGGKPMVTIGGAYYPYELAEQILHELHELLETGGTEPEAGPESKQQNTPITVCTTQSARELLIRLRKEFSQHEGTSAGAALYYRILNAMLQEK